MVSCVGKGLTVSDFVCTMLSFDWSVDVFMIKLTCRETAGVTHIYIVGEFLIVIIEFYCVKNYTSS